MVHINYRAMSTEDLWDHVVRHPKDENARHALLQRLDDEHTEEVQLVREHLRVGRIGYADALRVVMDFEIDWAMAAQAPDEHVARAIFLPDTEEEDMSALEASQQCDTIVELIDEEVSEEAFDKAGEFFEDVREKVIEVQETIQTAGSVSEGQQTALDNWEAGVRKWIR